MRKRTTRARKPPAARRTRERPLMALSFPSDTRYLAMVRDVARRFAESSGFEKADAQQIGLAVDEATTNVIEHAYGGAGNRETVCDEERLVNRYRSQPTPDIAAPVLHRDLGHLALRYLVCPPFGRVGVHRPVKRPGPEGREPLRHRRGKRCVAVARSSPSRDAPCAPPDMAVKRKTRCHVAEYFLDAVVLDRVDDDQAMPGPHEHLDLVDGVMGGHGLVGSWGNRRGSILEKGWRLDRHGTGHGTSPGSGV